MSLVLVLSQIETVSAGAYFVLLTRVTLRFTRNFQPGKSSLSPGPGLREVSHTNPRSLVGTAQRSYPPSLRTAPMTLRRL
jgi:hypothetical protein